MENKMNINEIAGKYVTINESAVKIHKSDVNKISEIVQSALDDAYKNIEEDVNIDTYAQISKQKDIDSEILKIVKKEVNDWVKNKR